MSMAAQTSSDTTNSRTSPPRPEDVLAGDRVVIPAAGRLSSPVDMDGLTGDVARHIGRQEHCGTVHFINVARSAHRYGKAEPLLRTRGSDRHDALRQRDIGCQRVDPDAVRCKLEGGCL